MISALNRKSLSVPLLVALLCLLPLMLMSCAPPPEKKKYDIVWPLPPDEPRIKFLDIIRSAQDFEKKRPFTDALFGEEIPEPMIKPYGVTVDKEGRIYVSDIGKVFVFDPKNNRYDLIGDQPGTGQLKQAIGIASASDGRLFVTDIGAARVYVYTNWKYTAAIGATGEFGIPSSVAVDEKRGLLYITDSRLHTVNVYSLNGYSKLRTFGKRGTDPGEFNFPTNIAVDAEGRVYVVDTGNFRVQIFDDQGKYIKSIGRLGDSPGALARPKGIAVDSEGHIYVVDTAYQNFQVFDQNGQILLAIGGAGGDPGEFLLPAGMYIDNDDKIYVVNQIPPSIQIFQYLGEKWKKKPAETGAPVPVSKPEGDAGKKPK
jgi:hypothetical protein